MSVSQHMKQTAKDNENVLKCTVIPPPSSQHKVLIRMMYDVQKVWRGFKQGCQQVKVGEGLG